MISIIPINHSNNCFKNIFQPLPSQNKDFQPSPLKNSVFSPAGHSSAEQSLDGRQQHRAVVSGAAPSRAIGHDKAVATWLTRRRTGEGQPEDWSLPKQTATESARLTHVSKQT